MDPDACLKEIRSKLAEVANSNSIDPDRFYELVASLDEWISKGGFLPEAWQTEKSE